MRTPENNTTPAQACEHTFEFFMEHLSANDGHEVLTHFLTGGSFFELSTEHQSAFGWMVKLMKDMAITQQAQTVHSCTLKIA